jgi:UDP-N-acetyl-D-galactosamine dehydrogenase
VIDIYTKLRSYGVEPLVHDPLADPQAILEEYGIAVAGWEDLRGLDALILAVPHSEFGRLGADRLCELAKDGGLFVDIKSKFRPEELRADLKYWSL